MSDVDFGQRIPRHLDDPAKFLWWEMDQAFLALGLTGMGMLVNMLAFGALLGVTVAWAFGKLKAGRGRGVTKHLGYWHLGLDLGFRRTPTSNIGVFIG
ncbi:MAG: type IV conjugative transfer system protein TraL [Mariprofundales bacterium]